MHVTTSARVFHIPYTHKISFMAITRKCDHMPSRSIQSAWIHYHVLWIFAIISGIKTLKFDPGFHSFINFLDTVRHSIVWREMYLLGIPFILHVMLSSEHCHGTGENATTKESNVSSLKFESFMQFRTSQVKKKFAMKLHPVTYWSTSTCT